MVSVKPPKPAATGDGIKPPPGRQEYVARNIPVRTMISLTLSVAEVADKRGPAWLDDNLYDVDAKADRPYRGQNANT